MQTFIVFKKTVDGRDGKTGFPLYVHAEQLGPKFHTMEAAQEAYNKIDLPENGWEDNGADVFKEIDTFDDREAETI